MKKLTTTKAKRKLSISPHWKQSLGSAKFLILLLLSSFFFSCEKFSDLEEVLDDKLNKDKENAIRVFKVDLHPLNNSGVEGTASFTYVVGGNFQAEVNARNLVPNMVHPQHIHAKSECPPMSAAGEDGLLTLPEGLPFYGEVFIPLDDNLVPLEAEEFPMANRNGQLNYAQRAKLSQFMAAFDGGHKEKHADELLNLGNRTIVLHGAYVKDNMIVPPGTEGAEYWPSLPVACGEIKEAH